jgi:putative tryptophan/tyrosine transport system substrate-binding protein
VIAAFTDGLRDLGRIEGESVIIEYRGADGLNERPPGLAAELVGHGADVVVGGGTPAGGGPTGVHSHRPACGAQLDGTS